MKNILFVASECVPFIKTGGLADVVGALPKSLNKERFDVRVVIPNYRCIPQKYRDQFRTVCSFDMQMGNLGMVYVGILEYDLDGIKYYFIDNKHYFNDDAPYGDFHWDIEKFCFFSQAALSMLPSLNFHPDVIHCHDWQAGIVPVLLHTHFKNNPFYDHIRTVMTIHNLRFQGVWDIPTFKLYTNLPDEVFTPGRMEYKKDANMLKGGLVYCDRITTVSGTYAEEIKTPYYGEGLDGLLRAKSGNLSGIVNGIDYDIYNPATDSLLFERYSWDTFYQKKAQNKRGLQRQLGLPEDDNKFVVAIISRLTDQKGLDLVNWVMDGIVDSYVQLVVLGTGDPKYENMFKHYQWLMNDRVSANIYYSDELAHKIYGGADAMLVPSRFEPCGLTQLISLRYGTVPIVRETGGLRDTVWPFNEFEGTGTGFSFANYDAGEMLGTINYAKKIYYDNRNAWDHMAIRGMQSDFSWVQSAGKYEALYDSITW